MGVYSGQQTQQTNQSTLNVPQRLHSMLLVTVIDFVHSRVCAATAKHDIVLSQANDAARSAW